MSERLHWLLTYTKSSAPSTGQGGVGGVCPSSGEETRSSLWSLWSGVGEDESGAGEDGDDESSLAAASAATAPPCTLPAILRLLIDTISLARTREKEDELLGYRRRTPKHEKKRGCLVISASADDDDKKRPELERAKQRPPLPSFFNSQIGKDPQSRPHHSLFLLGRIYLWIGISSWKRWLRQAPVEEKVRIASPSHAHHTCPEKKRQKIQASRSFFYLFCP